VRALRMAAAAAVSGVISTTLYVTAA